MIKTINDIPNNEVGRYLSCAIGALVKAEELINNREMVSPDDILEALNRICKDKVAVDVPPTVARVDLIIGALEDEMRDMINGDYNGPILDGLERAVEIIKEFKEVEV